MGLILSELGDGGISLTHTCPDLEIGLELGWTGLLDKVKQSRKQWEAYGNQERV